MSGARSRAHRNAQTALPGSSTAAASGHDAIRPPRRQGLQTPCPPLSYIGDRDCKTPPRRCGCSSGVEHNLAKVGVGGSNPLARSKDSLEITKSNGGPPGPLYAYTCFEFAYCKHSVSRRKESSGYQSVFSAAQ